MATVFSAVLNFFVVNQALALKSLFAALFTGILLGPAMGTLLFMVGGFDFMVFAFGGGLIFLAVSFQFMMPASLDMHTDF